MAARAAIIPHLYNKTLKGKIMLDTKEKALEKLSELNIAYELFEHQAVFTIEEMLGIGIESDAEICKNLFVRNQKGNMHYLIVQKGEKRADLSSIGEKVGVGRLSFASEDRLKKYLKLEKGEVTPLSVINDENHEVIVIVDNDLFGIERVGVHPNTNTATVVISFEDLIKYVNDAGNEVIKIDI